jgi:plexin A
MLQKLQTIGEDFCGLDVNTPLGGEQAASAVPVQVFGSHLTAVAATSTGDYTVVFLGTANGHLKKVSSVRIPFQADYAGISYSGKEEVPQHVYVKGQDYFLGVYSCST